jgi:transposase InsO family protein
MPWKEQTVMSQRIEFVRLALRAETNMTQLCQQYGISRKTGYKWLRRYKDGGVENLVNRSRRPHHSPRQTCPAIEEKVMALRTLYPVWGGRKLRALLESQGETQVPAASTITEIIRRHGGIDAEKALQNRATMRFERAHPNELWQMDFKGHFELGNGRRCHPLTVIDDHSRFLLGLNACRNEVRATVQACLIPIFRAYGLPEMILCDNGPPWGAAKRSRFTKLGAWIIRLGITLIHGRLKHPQTQGKDERLHRTLREEVLTRYSLYDFEETQRRFDEWRQLYNEVRPHEAHDQMPPANYYQPSTRPYPEKLPPISYDVDFQVRRADENGRISFLAQEYRVGKAFVYQYVGLRPTLPEGVYEVYFCHQKVGKIDTRQSPT